MRFAVFTHVIHQKQENRYFAYSPYVRELNIWLKYVDEVEIVAPQPLPAPQTPKGEKHFHGLSYEHFNLTLTIIPSFDLLHFTSSVKAVCRIPLIIFKLTGAMRRADHLHLRCPGNIGLLACICQIFFPKNPKTAKYAGNWDPKAKQPWSYRLQKWILSNQFLTRNMTVLVYGDWQDHSKNILPFFTASFSDTEIEKIEKDLGAPYKFLFVGNLVPGKQPLFAVRLVEALKEKNINAELHIYGDGPLKDSLNIEVGNLKYIKFHGNQPLHVVKQAYKEAHFLILASKSEGWPKAVAEAMFFGCVPIATAVSCVPWMLNYGSRGILAPPPDSYRDRKGGASNNEWVEEIVKKIKELLKDHEEMKRMSIEAQEWSQQYTLERFEEAIKDVLFKSKFRS